MREELFADGIGEITVSGTTVRIDLVSLSATERDAENKPRLVFRQRVIMPIDTFMAASELIERVARGLIDAGTVRRVPAEQAPPATVSAAPSPNFP
jgi:hypothetical protein